MKFELVEVERFPADVRPSILYWSREFKMCAHRCACGCGDVIQLPVDDLNYRISIGSAGVSLHPSIGNWGVCDAHYYISDGGVEWMPQWSQAQIEFARWAEDSRREAHYARKINWIQRLLLGLTRFRAWFSR